MNKTVQLSNAMLSLAIKEYFFASNSDTCKVPSNVFTQQIKKLSSIDFSTSLITDKEKIAFWINIFHVLTIYLSLKYSNYSYNQQKYFTFYQPIINIKSIWFLSLSGIFNGILRKNRTDKNIFVMPFLNKIDPRKKLVVDSFDNRIHFLMYSQLSTKNISLSLNEENIENKLIKAKKLFKNNFFNILEDENIIEYHPLFNQYKSDFKGEFLDSPIYSNYFYQEILNANLFTK